MTKNNDTIYIALGANLSNPKDTFPKAIEAMRERGVELIACSGLWQSPAWPPGSDAPDYINAVISVRFDGPPQDMLSILHEVERDHGRIRSVRNAPRTLDLDILDFKGQLVETAELSIPHPRMLSRGFVLMPLSQIAPDWSDPLGGENIMSHIAKLPVSEVEPMTLVGKLEISTIF